MTGELSNTGSKQDGGFWRLAHEELAALLSRQDLSWEVARVYLALADLTVGYGKPRDVVSIGQIAGLTGIERPHVHRALKRLEGAGLAGHMAAQGQRVTRWVVWPAPAVANPGTVAEVGNSTVATAGSATVAKPVAGAGTHQDTKMEEASKKILSEARTTGHQAGFLPADQTRETVRKPKAARRPKPDTDPRVAEFITWFAEEFALQTGRRYVVQGGKEGKTVKGLLASLDIEQLQQATAGMFADNWGRASASIGVLASQINKWLSGPQLSGSNGGGRLHAAKAAAGADYDAVTERFTR